MRKVLVTGDREWTDYDLIEHELASVEGSFWPGIMVIHGGARGADSLAGRAAVQLGLSVRSYPARWSEYGRKAGPIRNALMLQEHPDVGLVLAFHDDLSNSKGTAGMIKLAQKAGIPVKLVSHG